MAEGNDFSDFKKIEELIYCSICDEILDEPKQLPNCFHVFCFKCIQQWAQRCQKERKQLNCPSCRESINPREGDVNNLPASFHHNALIQVYSNSEFYKKKKQQELDDAKVEVTIISENLAEMLEQCIIVEEHTDENMQRADKEIDLAENEVRRNTLLQVEILQKHEQAKLRRLRTIRTKRKAEHGETKMKISNHVQEILELNNQCQQIKHANIEQFKGEDFEQLLDACKIAIEKAKSTLLRNQVQFKSAILYRPNPKVITALEDLHIGEIKIQMTDSSQSSIEHVYPTKCGFLNWFSIVTRDSKGEECYTNKALIDVTIQDNDGNDVHKEITESQSGNCIVFFKVTKPSPYNVMVSIAGKAVQNSPLAMNVTDAKAEIKPVRFFPITRASHPQAVAINDNGDILILNNDKGRYCSILFYGTDDEYVGDFGGEETLIEDQLSNPLGLAFINNDHLLVTDNTGESACIKEYHLDGRLLRITYKQNGMIFTRICTSEHSIVCLSFNKQNAETSIMLFSKETSTKLQEIKLHVPFVKALPLSLAYLNDKYFVSYNDIHSIYVFDKNGDLLYWIGGEGTNKGQLSHPCGLAVFGADLLLVCDAGNHRLQLFSEDGVFIRTFGSHGSGLGQVYWPADVFVTPYGDVFVMDCFSQHIQVFR